MIRKINIILTTIILSLGIILKNDVATADNEGISKYHKDVAATMNQVYLSLDEKTKDYMKVQNYHIIFLQEGQKCIDAATDLEPFVTENTTAYINYTTKNIKVAYLDEDKPDWIICNLYHEIGHMIDERLGFISNTSDFDMIYRLRHDFFDRFKWDNVEYFKSNRMECFAQMYSNYKQHGEWQKENFPSIYEYFYNIEN